MADDKSTFLIMQDSTKHWTLHSVVDSDEEMKAAFERTVGIPVKYEMLSCAPWRQNLLLADRYGKDRVFLAGDAVHLVIPTGGLGMNSGVGDAIDLSWKLAATLAGWGGPNCSNPTRSSAARSATAMSAPRAMPRSAGANGARCGGPNIRDNTPAGAADAQNLAAVADVEQRKSNEMIGAELGYRYVDSPVICNMPGGPGASVPRISADHLARRAAAACLARRRHGDAGPHRRRLHDPQARRHARPTSSGLERAIRAHGAPVTVLDVPDRSRARHLRLRSHFQCAPTCTWSGAATRRRRTPRASRRSRPGIGIHEVCSTRITPTKMRTKPAMRSGGSGSPRMNTAASGTTAKTNANNGCATLRSSCRSAII